MKVLLIFLLGIGHILPLFLAHPTPPDVNPESWRSEYKQAKLAFRQANSAAQYRRVLRTLLSLRPRMPRSWQMDYMIGVAACNGRDAVCNPRFYFRNSYNQAPNSYQNRVLATLQQCSQPDGSVGNLIMSSVPLDQPFGMGGSLGVFKMGSVEKVEADKNTPLTVSDSVSEKMYQARLFRRNDSAKLADVMRSFSIFSSTAVYYAPHFVITADRSVSPGEMERMSRNLERAYTYFQRDYGFQTPGYLMAAYYLNNREWESSYTGQGGFMQYVPTLARKKDRMLIPKGIIGYNNPNDLSIIGFAEGTLFHELMHILLYYNFGDAPAWFAEGLPALYEVSAFRNGDRLEGLPSWRSRYLFANGKLQTTPLDTLFRLDKASFNVPTHANAVHVATARYFCLYLQERGKLTAVFQALRTLPIDQIIEPDAMIKAIETAAGYPMNALQNEFNAYLRRINNVRE